MTSRATRRTRTLAIAADVAVVTTFVAIGRRNHDEDLSPSGFAGTLAPFLIALALSWSIGRVWSDSSSPRSGVVVWVGTVGIGMVLRRFMFDDGTATAFVIVAAVFIGTATNGWRALARFRAGS